MAPRRARASVWRNISLARAKASARRWRLRGDGRQRAADQFCGDSGVAAHRRQRSARRLSHGIPGVGGRAERRRSESPSARLPRKARREDQAAGMTNESRRPKPAVGERSERRARRAAQGRAKAMRSADASQSPRLFGALDPVIERRPDGVIVVRSALPLPPYAASFIDRLEHWGRLAPERAFLAERDAAGGWRTLTYGAASEQVLRLGSALLARGLSPERPLLILSGNSIDH